MYSKYHICERICHHCQIKLIFLPTDMMIVIVPVLLELFSTVIYIFTFALAGVFVQNMFISYEHYLTLSFAVIFSYVREGMRPLSLKNKSVVITYPV